MKTTKTNPKAAAAKTGDRPLIVEATKGETEADTMARVMVGPYLRHGILSNAIADKMVGKLPGEPRFDDYARVLKARADKTGSGDSALVSELLTSQALTLDAMFTEMARRATINMGDYIEASERYARLALKAQANSRAALEALVRLHQPRVQIVKHVHVSEGGQAVVADDFHHHTGGSENGKSIKQSDATGAAGESAALLCPDASGIEVPSPGRERQAAMQDARRDESGAT
jgi:hypothetical protein